MPGALQDGEMEQEVETQDAAPSEQFIVMHQEVTLELNFREKCIQGESRIKVFAESHKIPEVSLDARQCEIDVSKITVNGKRTIATYRDSYESLDIPETWYLEPRNYPVWKNRMKNLSPRNRRDTPITSRDVAGCTPCDGNLRISLKPPAGLLVLKKDRSEAPNPDLHEIVIPFKTKHIRDGLHFVGVEDWDTRFPHAYTCHSMEPGNAACLFPCVDDRGARCMWKIHINTPKTLGDAMRQPLAAQQMTNGANGTPLGSSSGQVTRTLSEEDKLLDMTVVCSGNLVGEKEDPNDDSRKIMTFEINDHPAAATHVGFAVGPFKHVDLWSEFRTEEVDEKLGASALKLHGYCLPGREEEVKHSCAALAPASDDFTMTYGRFPFDSYKICFVDDMVGDTAPLHSFSLCTSRLLFPPKVIDTEVDVLRKLVHALASQYFGVYIVPNELSDMWLTVGIAYYMTDLYLSKLCGNNDYRFRMKTMVDKLVEEDRNRPPLHDLGKYLYLGDFEMDFMKLKAPLVLFILDKRLSKASGSAGASLARAISKVISRANTSMVGVHTNEILTSEQFRKICEKTGQYKLESFWNQWVKGSGCPYLDITQRFNKKQLCVEVSINQVQVAKAAQARPIPKDDFWRELLEETNEVFAGAVQPLFTGPMTIRIHEANGTPYEHIVDIREDAVKGAKFSVPYNTKYKRLKRNRRQREKAAQAAALDPNSENPEDVIVASLGDKLDSPEDVEEWDLADWNEAQENKMDQESYEWIRIDSDFEWICHLSTNLPPWMYLSQLQQDKDVAAQQDSLLFLNRVREHAMNATILTRTIYDERYFHGLRTMAADILSRQTYQIDGGTRTVHRGMELLIKLFQGFFCYDGLLTPAPNDFSDKRQYHVQCAIAQAIGDVHYQGKHPREAQKFLLEQLALNNNDENEFSDHFYIATLLRSLARSLVSINDKDLKGSRPEKMSFSFGEDEDSDDEMPDADPMEAEDKAFLQNALNEIERYRLRDDHLKSYQNVITRAALDAKCILMKAGVIPVSALAFVQYCQDGNLDVVQITAFECLIELGLMLKPVILNLLLTVMSTHPSPYVRDQLFKRFVRGLAAIAFGEHTTKEDKPKEKPKEIAPEDDSGLIIEAGDDVIARVQVDHARREGIEAALAGLKEELSGNETLQKTMWQALQSRAIGNVEKRNLMELMDVLFVKKWELLIFLKQPCKWKCKDFDFVKGKRAILHFEKFFPTITPRPQPEPAIEPAVAVPALPSMPSPTSLAAIPSVLPPFPPRPEVVRKPTKIKLSIGRSSLGGGGPATPGGATPATPSVARAASISGGILAASPTVATPAAQAPVADSIAVLPRTMKPYVAPVYVPSPPSAQPPASASPSRAPTPSDSKRKRSVDSSASPQPAKLPAPKAPTPVAGTKRKHEDGEGSASPGPRKMARIGVTPGMLSKLKPEVRTWLETGLQQHDREDSIRAIHPAAAAAAASASPPGGSTPAKVRKPLPGAKKSESPAQHNAGNGNVGGDRAREPSVGQAGSPPPAAPLRKVIKLSVKPKLPQPG